MYTKRARQTTHPQKISISPEETNIETIKLRVSGLHKTKPLLQKANNGFQTKICGLPSYKHGYQKNITKSILTQI
jgi:hypothetical protein